VANHKSAEKRNRQRLKRRERNVFHLSTMRTYMKRLRKALEGNDLEGAKENLPLALQAIGKAASKGVIHRNTASRYASRVTLAFNKKVERPGPVSVPRAL
jgi:small subunit ribosomal protein S20